MFTGDQLPYQRRVVLLKLRNWKGREVWWGADAKYMYKGIVGAPTTGPGPGAWDVGSIRGE
jgi:hypothetical protein